MHLINVRIGVSICGRTLRTNKCEKFHISISQITPLSLLLFS